MEVRQQAIDDLKLEPGVDERRRFAARGLDAAAVVPRRILESTGGRRTHRDDPASLAPRPFDRLGRCGPDLVALGIDLMLLDDFAPHGLERAVADMERHVDAFDAAGRERLENFRREVEAGRWRSDRSAHRCVNGLVTLSIRVDVVALDVGWQRNMSQRVNQLPDGLTRFGSKTHEAAPEEPALEHFRRHRSRWPFESDDRADAQFLAGMDERVPHGVPMVLEQETLGGTS